MGIFLCDNCDAVNKMGTIPVFNILSNVFFDGLLAMESVLRRKEETLENCPILKKLTLVIQSETIRIHQNLLSK